MSETKATAPLHGPAQNHNHWFFFTSSNNFIYATRTAIAAIACLLVSMYVQLDVPRWSILTVIIISPPVRGNALRKTMARIVGTIAGCAMGVILVALFPQDPVAFMLGFAAWLGVCAYYATFKRGFVAYAPILAAFTCAIITANAPVDPRDVFFVALDRGAATILAVIFALFASELSGRNDDAPGEFVNRVTEIATGILDWALKRLDPAGATLPEEVPFAGASLGIDELAHNAIAERAAMRWVRPWITGLPTALVSLQSEVLIAARQIRLGISTAPELAQTRQALMRVRDLITARCNASIGDMRDLCNSLVQLRADLDHATAREPASLLFPALAEIISSVRYLLAAIESVLMLKDADQAAVRAYPPPVFLPMYHRARTNLMRGVAGIIVGSIIYNVTAWPDAPFFLVNIAVAMVIYLQVDNPLTVNSLNIVGIIAGAVLGITIKQLLLPISDNPVWLAMTLFPPMFIGALALTRPALTAPAIGFTFVTLTVLELDNPQQYNFAQTINTILSFIAAYTFVPLIFLMIGAPKKGRERVDELFTRLRDHLRRAERNPFTTRVQRLQWETGMYDALQMFQAEVKSPADRAAAVDLMLSARKFIVHNATPSIAFPIQTSPG